MWSFTWVWQLAVMLTRFRMCVWMGLCWAGVHGLSAQDSSQVQYRYPDGTISSEGQLLNGLPEGYWVSYFPDGTRKSEGNWRQGQLEGEWVFYDEKGRVQTTLFYASGLKDGIETQWDTTGIRLRTLPWVQDTLQGWEEGYDADGVIRSRIPWSGGEKEGVALDYAVEEGKQGRILRRRGFREDLLRWVEEVNRLDDQNRKTGKWMTFWPNGQVRQEGLYERGLEEGVFKYFSRRGDLERTVTFHRGEEVEDAPEAVVLDLRKAFHPNGEVSREGPWREDTPMGTHRFFDEEGHLVEVKVFRFGVLQTSGMLDSMGRRSGPWTEFWPDGTPKAVGSYLEGKRDGDWQFYARDGRLEQEGGFRMDLWHGRWTWYHPNGQVHRDERYRKGREDGDFLELGAAGDTLAMGSYERGRKVGPWVEHVRDDRREGVYLDGDLDGRWIHTDGEGRIRFEGAYVAGIPTGEHTTFWPTGRRASVGLYRGGLRDGIWRYFDENGVVQLIRQYKAGRIVKVNGAKTDR